MFKGGSTPTTSTETPTESPSESVSNEVNRVIVYDQYPGNIVYVSSAQLAQPGWLEIHKDNNGTPGAIIGSTYFDKGINPGKVTLTEKTVDGGTYYAMLHSDDGDKKFDPTKDLPLKDSKGDIVMRLFHATFNVQEMK